MLNRLFGNYLVNRGYLNPAQLDDLLETITEYKADPQTVILVNKFLPLSQIRFIQQSQMQEESFTEAALRLQLLTDNQIEQIVQFQSLPVMCFAQLLLDKQILQTEDIMCVLADFQMYYQFTDEQLHVLCIDDMEQIIRIFVPFQNPRMHELTVTLLQTIKRLIDKNVYLDKAYMAHSIQIDRYAAQTLSGDLNVKFYLSAPINNLLAIANYFGSETYDVINDDALDNVGEFINCVSGLFATNLSYEGIDVDMDAPRYGMEGPYLDNGKIYVIPIHANRFSFRAVFELCQ